VAAVDAGDAVELGEAMRLARHLLALVGVESAGCLRRGVSGLLGNAPVERFAHERAEPLGPEEAAGCAS